MRPNDLDKDVKLPKGLVRRVFRFAKPYRTMILTALVLILLTSLATAAGPRIIKEIIDRALAERSPKLLSFFVLLYLAAGITASLLGIAMRWLLSRIGEGLIFDLRSSLFDHVQRMPIAFFTRTQTGALLSRLNNDVVGAQRAITGTTADLLQTVADLVATLGAMLALSWRLTLVALVAVPFFVLPTRFMGKTLQKLVKKQMEYNASMNTQMTERFQIGGALLVKLFGNYRKEHSQFEEKAGNVRDLGIRTAVFARMFFVTFSLAAVGGTALSYWLGGRMVIAGSIKVGVIVAFSLYLTRLYGPITGLSNTPVEVRTALVSFDRVFEVLDFPSIITEKEGAIDVPEPKGKIDFDHVWFRYPPGADVSLSSLEEGRVDAPYDEEAWVLRDVSFTVEPGQMVALVGPSGAGKTTMSMLVARLYDATQGAVRIGGADVRDLKLESLGAAVGTVTQDAHMFHDTMRTNLLYAKPDATESEMVQACRAAQIYDLIQTLPEGFDTTVGERGYRLSGGEKQRLAIARLLLKDPAIMILDEATAHLDSESEVLIQKALAEALSGRSSIVIAHRLSTIVKADQILVIEGGKIVEKGRHAELLGAGGLYGDLYRTQFQAGSLDVA
ncbi:MAG: ABC transporter ATP-binding protein/permease [Actinobacteria bacterium]|nr:ABC transporter ATP-binding protein/permease [Actinomycetota bacterium]